MKFTTLVAAALFACSIGVTAKTEVPTSSDTCADPSLVVPFVQGFNTVQDAYALASVAGYTAGITRSPTSGWIYQGEAFLGWPTPQNFTFPFYRFFNPTTTDYISTTSTDGSAPSIPGFTLQGTLGYAYTSSVCSSVPLLGAFNQAAGSHYYTTDPNVHTDLLSQGGWTNVNSGVFVLPLSFVWYVNFIKFTFNAKWIPSCLEYAYHLH
ncbi:hypothetical protein BDN70DRAFT_930460 [Pholiota conissans]|uniref:DUF5648 domain-containing protein n=1 Tax=Pholiota conissans TaxID=109636 RepID=A0A9P5Z8H4_9AGAR|nr:hypothetical protein BDN70DRAFT_930460 [Pholiota conissans]